MNYLDIRSPYIFFEEKINSPIYVDKSLLIEKMNELIRVDGKYVCITRPRRFGKTINANMLGAYYTKGFDSHPLFDHLSIAKTKNYEKHLNQHHVIYINFSRMPDFCDSFTMYFKSIRRKLLNDIAEYYTIDPSSYDSISDALNACKDSFIFILDEWDSIFYKDFMSEKDKIEYLGFLNELLKDQPYVELAYMTGVLPIAKYSSGSALNVFKEYSFLDDHTYDAFFGFSEYEVRKLCEEKKTIPYDQLHSCAQSEVLV